MKFISKTCWKQLFETALQKQQQLAPSIEHPTTLSLKKVSKIEIVYSAQILQNT